MPFDIQWCKISRLGVLQFDGADAQAFLQGQLTNDVAALAGSRSQYTGYCTPKGRLLAVPLLWQRDQGYHMLLPLELCEVVRKRLSMYILRSKVKAADISSQLALYGVAGAGAAVMVRSLTDTAPESLHSVAHTPTATVLKLPTARWLIVAHAAAAGTIESALAAAAAGSDDTLWAALDIEAGIPSISTATQEQFVPQTVNLDCIGALSFDKGCYTGQEIVARTHYLGKLKQRMVRAQVQALQHDAAPAAGDKLFSAGFGEQASGMIVSALRKGPQQHEVLAVVQTGNIDGGDVRWQSPAGPVLHIVPLPYPLI